MPKGHYQRVARPPNGDAKAIDIQALEARLTELERLRDVDDRRLSAIERRIAQMNDSFSMGYFPPNAQQN
jgi:hypothetical protein